MADVDEFVETGEGKEETLTVPKERIGAVIGKKGKVKKRLETIGDVKISINSDTGEIKIKGGKNTDPITFSRIVKVIRAIGKGFDYDTAKKLLDEEMYLETINLKDVLRRNDIKRQKARLIGTKGSARKKFEELTDTDIRIYGNEVSIIGDYESIMEVKNAILRLIVEGSPHNVVFRELEERRYQKKREKLLRELGIVVDEE